MNFRPLLLALLVGITTAQAAEPFLKFPGVFYGDNRNRTEEEEKLFMFVKEKADAPSRYYRLSKAKYLVTVDSAYIISGFYLVALDEGYANKIIGGNVEVVEEHKTKNNDLWFLVHSASMHMGVGSDSYSAIILNSTATQTPIVSWLASVRSDDNTEGTIVSYKVEDKNGDGSDDITFRIYEKDLTKNTENVTETTYIFKRDGFYKKP